MNHASKICAVGFLVLLAWTSCSDGAHEFAGLTRSDFGRLADGRCAIEPEVFSQTLQDLCAAAKREGDPVDVLCNTYYQQGGKMVWVTRAGVDGRADTLLSYLQEVSALGFPEDRFYIQPIRQLLERTHTLDFDDANTASQAFAQLEYYLTKAYLRYAKGQRFGFVNVNRTPVEQAARRPDAHRVTFPVDMAIEKFSQNYFNQALQAVRRDSVGPFLQATAPTDQRYYALLSHLADDTLNATGRQLVLANMERFRWRVPGAADYNTATSGVFVNIPEQALHGWRHDGECIDMKVCYGDVEHKTPLIASQITHMELNPYWNVPISIAKGMAASGFYAARGNYQVLTSSGKLVASCTLGDLLAGRARIRQDRGRGNSLGTIIFRFPNNNSIYLHDTNAHYVFGRAIRAVSHGCIRVQRPYDLAMFLLNSQDDKQIDKIRLSLQMAPLSDWGKRQYADSVKYDLRRVEFEQHTPLWIGYYTCLPQADGRLAFYHDIYEYDPALIAALQAK